MSTAAPPLVIRRVVVGGAQAAALGGLIVAAAWLTGHWASEAWGMVGVPSAPLTAAALVVLGGAVAFQAAWPQSPSVRAGSRAAALVVAVPAAWVVVRAAAGLTVDPEALFIPAAAFPAGDISLGRMSTHTALTLLLTAAAVIGQHAREGWPRQALAPVCASAVVASSLLALFGYAAGASRGSETLFVPMAVPTALMLLALGAALVVSTSPDSWLVAGLLGSPSTVDSGDRAFSRALTVTFLAVVAALTTVAYVYLVQETRHTPAGKAHLLVWPTGTLVAGASLLLAVGLSVIRHQRDVSLLKADLAERNRREDAERNYRLLFEEMIDGFALHELILDEAGRPADYRFLAVNPAFERQTGLRAADLIGRRVLELMPGLERSWIERYGRVTLTGEAAQFESYTRELDRHFRVTAYRPAPGQFACIIEDVTDRVRTAEHRSVLEHLVAERTAELRERERRLSIVADNTFDWEWWRDTDGRFLYCSPSCERLTGYTRDEFTDDVGLLGRIVHPDDAEAVHSHEADRVAFGPIEFRVQHRDGSTRWVEHVCKPLFGDGGEYLGRRGSNRDITERKSLQSQVLRMQRQESLSRLAGGIAHDLNNVLAPVMMGADLLQTAPLGEGQRECLDMIRVSAVRGADLVKHLLLYTRGADGRRRPLDPTRTIREVARMAGETFPKTIRVRVDVPAEPWQIEADETQLHQVLLNLCVNARDAMSDGGSIALVLEHGLLAEAEARALGGARPGPYVVVTVADTGTGIPRDVIDHIFEPFYTTKPPGQGTGLGLSTVQGIVAGHGGFVDVQSEPGHGTTFRVYLPALADGVPGLPEPDLGVSEQLMGHGETILVIDDERLIRELARRTLQGAGYHVLVADGGRAALALYSASRVPVALVLCDMWMPDMDGPKTIRRLARLDPGVRVIAMSGLAESKDAAMACGPIVRTFLPKPWRNHELLAAVAAAVRSARELRA